MTEKITEHDFPIARSWIVKAGTVDLFTFILLSSIMIGFSISDGLFRRLAYENFSEINWSPFIPLLLPLFYLLIYLKKMVYAVLWRKNFRYEIGDRDINLTFGVFGKTTRTTPYESLQGVEVSRDVLDRLFGSSTVKISSAANSLFDVQLHQSRSGLPLLGSYGGTIYLSGLSPVGAEKIKNVVLQKMKENPAKKSGGL